MQPIGMVGGHIEIRMLNLRTIAASLMMPIIDAGYVSIAIPPG